MRLHMLKHYYDVEYLVGKFEKQPSTPTESQTVPFWVCFETKDLTKAVSYISEQQTKAAADSRYLRVLKKSTTVKYDVV